MLELRNTAGAQLPEELSEQIDQQISAQQAAANPLAQQISQGLAVQQCGRMARCHPDRRPFGA